MLASPWKISAGAHVPKYLNVGKWLMNFIISQNNEFYDFISQFILIDDFILPNYTTVTLIMLIHSYFVI